MRILVQECLSAEVRSEGELLGSIQKGEVIFVSFTQSDDENICQKMLSKLLKLRIFPDENGKTNLNLTQVSGEILCVSQFTLYADLSQGNRPSFVKAQGGERAKYLYDHFCDLLKKEIANAQFGRFGADMKVQLINDGPFTIWLDSQEVLHG